MLQWLKAFIPATIAAYALASTLATASVMASLREMGVAVGPAVLVQATWHDLLGMASSYLPMILVALAVALLVAGALARFTGGGRLPWCLLAGAVAMLVLHLALQVVLQITPIAAARTAVGLTGQCAAGALGGLLFARLSRPRVPAG